MSRRIQGLRPGVRSGVQGGVDRRRQGGGLDPDAAAYITALEGDGVSVSGAQKAAINQFFVTAKLDGWYARVPRFHFPVWGSETPNTRCLFGVGVGSFGGSVTHSDGYVVGDGSSGYFDFDATFEDLGLTQTGAHLMALRLNDPDTGNRCMIGARPGASQMYYIDAAGIISSRQGRHFVFDASTVNLATPTGIFLSIVEGTTETLYRKGSSGTTSNDTGTIAGTIPGATNINAMRRLLTAPDQYDTGRHAAWSAGTLTNADAVSFLNAVAALYTGVTGSALPA